MYKRPEWFVGGESGCTLFGHRFVKIRNLSGIQLHHTLKQSPTFVVNGIFGLHTEWGVSPFIKIGMTVGKWTQSFERWNKDRYMETVSVSKTSLGGLLGIGLEKMWEGFGARLTYTATFYGAFRSKTPSKRFPEHIVITQNLSSLQTHAITLGGYITL